MNLSFPRRRHARAEPLLRLESFLPYRLNVLASLVSDALAEIYRERFGLSISGWRVMARLGQDGVRTAGDIAARGAMHKSTVSRAIASLEARGLVRREANPDDMREELLALTPAGQAIYEELAPEALAFEARFEAALSPAERATLSALLERLDRHARSLHEAPRAEAAE